MRPARQTLLLVTMALLLVMGTVAVTASTNHSEVSQITNELARLEPYIRYNADGAAPFQVFDADAARRDGFSEPVVQLAAEMVAYQNELYANATASASSEAAVVSVDKYPRVKEFFDMATANTKEGVPLVEGTEASPPACGNWTYPVPNYSPPWGGFSSSNPGQALINMGFHKTASYACGGGSCSNVDYTRARGYQGPYGYCSSPRFRDHGRVWSATTGGIQYGEPNPEILGYSWPYWNWGAYVQWWHSNF